MTITGHKIISLLSKSHQKPKCKAQYSLCQPFERQTLNVTSSYLFVTIDLVFINSCFLRVLYFRLCDWRPTGALNGLVFFGDGFFLDGERCVGKWTETGRLLGEFTIYIYIYTHTYILPYGTNMTTWSVISTVLVSQRLMYQESWMRN